MKCEVRWELFVPIYDQYVRIVVLLLVSVSLFLFLILACQNGV